MTSANERARRPIRVLPPALAARIAAGEVIERPASVVKELVENALDAGAREIRVEVRGGGLTLIRVSDDGIGIPPEELPLACQRHATSKLPGDDLTQIRTLGFRGEALPSIAAVAELTLVSAADDSGVGRRLTLRDGAVAVDEPAPRPRGTTVTVRRLFQNMPARLAAAGRPQAEVALIGQTVRRLALAAPHVRMTLVVDERQVLQTSGSGDRATTLIELYGPALAGRLQPLGPFEVAGACISGLIADPEVTRPGRNQVHVIVNGRWTQPRGLLTTIEAAYRPLLPRGRHPVLVLVIETEPEKVDVNIHPSKLEVRLLAEQEIGRAAGELIRTVLGQRPRSLQLPAQADFDPLATAPLVAEESSTYDDDGPIVTPGLPPLRLIGQVQARLLLLEGSDGLYLVDQHRAHERILYERLKALHGAEREEPFVLPDPLLIELRPAQAARFSRRLDELAALGFRCEVFGSHTFLLRAAPPMPGVLPGLSGDALAALGQPDELLKTLLALADEEAAGETWKERLWVELACRTAVRRGRPLERPAMRALVEALGHTAAPAVCPHGSPLLLRVGEELIARTFGW
ncbi:DNA mismatch repair protein MutL [bacterium HR26]|nr:DNA mismatch repair protein MutL [bacterium HR26]